MENEKEKVLNVLNKISNINFQKDVWVKQNYWDEILNFGEAVNTLDDYCFFDDVEEGKIRFSDPTSQEKLKYFAKDLLAYEEPYNPKEILQDPKWKDIVEKAGELNKLLSKITF